MRNYIIFVGILLFINTLAFSQVEKAKKNDVALTNATLYTITSGIIENATLLIQDGKITARGAGVTIPAGAKVIDCSGLNVYPGFIDGGTHLGLSEVGSISLTQDYNEIGDIKPQMKTLTAVNPSSTVIPVTRVSGVTTVITSPAGGTIPGTAALINLVGYTPSQMYAGFESVVVNFPTSGKRGRRDNRSDEVRKKEETKLMKTLNKVIEEAQVHAKIIAQSGKAAEYNAVLDAMLPVVKGEMPIMLEVNKAEDIEKALKWVKEKQLKAIFTGVAEGWKVADKLAEAQIPVITGPMMRIPSKASDRYDVAYTNAGKMQKAGVKVAIRTNETENVRNLPFQAGFAAAYGMGKEEALRAVTINPAQIFGLSNKMGSLEKGKDATLFVADGDPFEPKTQIKHLFINGWNIPIDSRHIQLYHEFLERSPGLKK